MANLPWRVLLLEDTQARVDGREGIRTLCPSIELTWVTTPWDFEEKYKANEYDYVILDRDLELGGDGYSAGHEPTGEDVLGLIKPTQCVVVWSWNDRADDMVQALHRAQERAGLPESAHDYVVLRPFGTPECKEFLRLLEASSK
jgi:hypothetical protein